MLDKKRFSFVLTFIAMGIIVFSILTINFDSDKIDVNEKRELADFPILYNDEGTLRNDIKPNFELWLKDNIGFRHIYINISGFIQYNILHKSPNKMVAIGEDGWMFITEYDNLKIASGEYVVSDKVLKRILTNQKELQSYFKSMGKEYGLSTLICTEII